MSQQPTEEEMRHAMAQQAQLLALTAHPFAPHLTMPRLLELAAGVMTEQMELGPVLNDAVDVASRAAHPLWGVKITSKATNVGGVIKVSKNIEALKTIDEVMQYANVIGLATSPLARLLLRIYGLEYTFIQAKGDAPKKLILS